MIDSDYKTLYFKNNTAEGRELIDSLKDATNYCILKWERKYDTVSNEYYYYSKDDEYNETYYFYINTKTLGSLLQIVSHNKKTIFEFDDSSYKKELSFLANCVYRYDVDTKMIENKSNSYNYSNTYFPYKSYKEKKMEKAANQLSEIEPSTNMEYL